MISRRGEPSPDSCQWIRQFPRSTYGTALTPSLRFDQDAYGELRIGVRDVLLRMRRLRRPPLGRTNAQRADGHDGEVYVHRVEDAEADTPLDDLGHQLHGLVTHAYQDLDLLRIQRNGILAGRDSHERTVVEMREHVCARHRAHLLRRFAAGVEQGSAHQVSVLLDADEADLVEQLLLGLDVKV